MPTLTDVWRGQLGRVWGERNDLTPQELDSRYLTELGITRSELNADFLVGLPKDAAILEVGCGTGLQLRFLHDTGFTNLYGVDLNTELLKQCPHYVLTTEASADDLPFSDGLFDLVFTSGLLMHVPPDSLIDTMREIARVSCRWVWGYEYYSDASQEVEWRGRKGILWRDDHPKLYQSLGLRLAKVRYLPHIMDGSKVDVMFLLEKVHG